jgi:hypothetical protein
MVTKSSETQQQSKIPFIPQWPASAFAGLMWRAHPLEAINVDCSTTLGLVCRLYRR